MLLQRRTTIVAILLATVQGGCGAWFTRNGLNGIVESQVVGNWRLLPTGGAKFLDYPVPPGTASTVEFRSDGSCSLNHLVDNGDLFSGDGTWSLTTENDRGNKESVLEITLPNSSGGRPHIFTYFFARVHRQLILWQIIGDPDENTYIEYEHI